MLRRTRHPAILGQPPWSRLAESTNLIQLRTLNQNICIPESPAESVSHENREPDATRSPDSALLSHTEAIRSRLSESRGFSFRSCTVAPAQCAERIVDH